MRRLLIALMLTTLPLNIMSLYTGGYLLPADITAAQVREEEEAIQPEEQPDLTVEPAEEEVPEAEQVTEENEEPETTDIVISFTGDCTIGSDESYKGYTFHKVYNDVKDPAYFFREVKSIFEADDYTFINLEGTLTDAKKKADKEFRYKGPPSYCEILVQGGVDGCNLANNHTYDYLQAGFEQTVEVLKNAGIDRVYMDNYLIREIKGVKLGFLGYKGWSSEKKSNELLKKHVKELREQGVDFIIVSYHWGDMYSYVPNSQQIRMAHFAIDNGADLVIGHHPHVLQGMETYKGKNIVYSLGNFCYGGKRNPADKDTIIYQQVITYDNSKGEIAETSYRIIPASISSRTDINDFKPMIAEGKEAERILKKYEDQSSKIKAARP